MGLIDDLTAVANSILGIRDDVGAVIEPVFLVTRTWTGAEPGLGSYSDVVAQILPSPAVRNLATDFRAQSAGTKELSEIMLHGVSKQSYPTRDMIDCTCATANIERFYRVSGKIFNVTKVESSYITWNVRAREASHEG